MSFRPWRSLAFLLALCGTALSAQTTSWRLSGCDSAMVRPSAAGKKYVTKVLPTGVVCLADSVVTPPPVTPPPTPTPVPVPPGVSSSPWPNEPAGSVVLEDWGFDTPATFPAIDGSTIFRTFPNGQASAYLRNNGGGGTSRVALTDGPTSPPFALQFSYPVGFPTGGSPGTMYFIQSQPVTCAYTALVWKMSNPWQGNDAGSQKLADWFTNGQPHFVYRLSGGRAGPWQFDVVTSAFNGDSTYRAGTNGGTRTLVQPGTWYRVEYVFRAADRSVSWWVSTRSGTTWGAPVLQARVTGVVFPAAGVGEFQVYPGWGGLGQPKFEQDFFWYDHLRLSRCG